MDRNDIVNNFTGCIHCSQTVVEQWADKLGIDKATFMRIAGPLGGGCFRGDICGSVSGALLVIGAACGHWEVGDIEGNERMVEKVNEFNQAFTERAGSLICRELTGYDFSAAGQFEEAAASGVLLEKCPDFVNIALDILDEIL
ncbi:MAG: C-GCAxxG-C-C family protein [Lentihominibacter sp.]|jgi:C_GCAxxG_C_C family probable redox protein